jgi:hypothetical protein
MKTDALKKVMFVCVSIAALAVALHLVLPQSARSTVPENDDVVEVLAWENGDSGGAYRIYVLFTEDGRIYSCLIDAEETVSPSKVPLKLRQSEFLGEVQ